jgi:hypothetical protein
MARDKRRPCLSAPRLRLSYGAPVLAMLGALFGVEVAGCSSDDASGSASSSAASGSAASTGGSGGAGGEGAGGTPGGGGAGGAGGGNSAWAPRSKARMFLSGHSLTDNPLADYALEIAASLGKNFNYNEQIGIGSPIRVRTKGNDPSAPGWPGYSSGKNRDGSDMNVIEELKSPKTLGPGELYDTLVITERHDILGTIWWEDTFGYLRHYHDRLIDGNPAGHTLFYHSWLDINKSAPETWITHEKNALFAWECVASKVNLTLEAEGRADRVSTLPAGAALVDLVERILKDEVKGISGSTNQKLDAIFSDNVHMTHLGAYFLSLVTYAAVFRDSPVGAAVPNGVSAEPAADLQAIAWSFVSAYYNQEAPGERTMDACRTFISENVCPTFWTILGEPQQIQPCQMSYKDAGQSQNPFRWPDPMLMLWPDP